MNDILPLTLLMLCCLLLFFFLYSIYLAKTRLCEERIRKRCSEENGPGDRENTLLISQLDSLSPLRTFAKKHVSPSWFLWLALSLALYSSVQCPFLQEASPDLKIQVWSFFQAPAASYSSIVPTLITLICHYLVTGLSPPVEWDLLINVSPGFSQARAKSRVSAQ